MPHICASSNCTKHPSRQGGRQEAEHAEQDLVDVRNKRCGRSGCMTQPLYGKVGGKAEVCAEHANEGMVNVRHKRCGRSGCMTQPSGKAEGSRSSALTTPRKAWWVSARRGVGTAGAPSSRRTARWGGGELCSEHADEDMVNVQHAMCGRGGRNKQPYMAR